MTIDPQVLRSERFRTVGTILQRDAGVLIERWRRRALEEQPNGHRVHQDVLEDQLPGFLKALGRSLEEVDDPHTSLHFGPALEHGEQRWEAGWSLPEVVRDFQILRLVILEYLEETLDRPFRGREVMAVGLALDEAITASVGMYVSYREHFIRQAERERADQEKKAEEALTKTLKESDQRKNEFLAILGHELRNSLAPILNSVEALRLAGPPETGIHQVRDMVERQARQMARLLDDLLDLSKIARGQVELRKERLELAAAVAQAIETSGSLIQSRRHKLSVSLPHEPLILEADRARLVQVIANLLNNAAKYTDEGGQIRLSGERDNEQAVIRVQDTGMGIPPEMLGRIFDLFIRVDGASDRSPGGLGVGLALVRQLVEMHGGTVIASSPGVGKGSEFVIRLPALPEERPVPTPDPVSESQATSCHHVLLVEDHPDGRETMGALLKVMGHQVVTAEDGPKGLQMALAIRPRVALIDLGLPRMDGFQLAQEMRKALGEKIYLVAMTGYGQAEDRQRTLEAGFDAHLVKPVNLDDLNRLLGEISPAQP